MAPLGILFIYGALSPEPTPLPDAGASWASGLTIRGYMLVGGHERSRNGWSGARRSSTTVSAEGSSSRSSPRPSRFEQIVEAHRYLESNQQIGKIVVTVSPYAGRAVRGSAGGESTRSGLNR